jgi:2'-5' RNA ligase
VSTALARQQDARYVVSAAKASPTAKPVADTMPGSKRPASVTIADRVKAQLQRDYPPNALSWVASLSWTGPASVPAGQIDRTTGDTEWSAAAADKAKLQRMRTRISAGWKKPVILIRRPGQRLLFSMDGHSRILACAALGVPVTAYIGTAKTAHGEWERTHARQLAGDGAAIDLSATGYPAGTIKPRSGMISLDLPEGTIKPVPGGTDDHHITVVYLGPDVDDKAFAAACKRAKAAAASASGPLTGTVAGVGSFPAAVSDDGKIPAFAPASVPGAKAIRLALEDLSASEHKQWKPHVTLAYADKDGPLPDPVPSTPVRFTHLSVHRGKQVARFPLGGGTAEHAGSPAGIELSARTPALAVTPSPWGSPSGPGLWKHKGWKLPDYVEQVSKGIRKSGRAASEAEAIQMALGVLRRWASGGGKVTPEVRAASAKAIADYAALKARAHAHANDTPAVELAGTFTEALHPRVAKGHGNAGQFGSQGTALKGAATPAAKPATAAVQAAAPEPPAEAARIRQLRHQAKQDRVLAHTITNKANALVRVRDGYIAGVLTSTGKPATVTKAVSAAKSAAAKKAAATRKKAGPAKKKAKSSTKSAAQTKAANIGKLNHLLRHDAKALIKSANHLDQIANGL